jgi:hypothetical protein
MGMGWGQSVSGSLRTRGREDYEVMCTQSPAAKGARATSQPPPHLPARARAGVCATVTKQPYRRRGMPAKFTQS